MFTKVIAALAKLKQYPAFTSNTFNMDVAGLWKRININHSSMNVTVIGNFNVVTATGNPNFQQTGRGMITLEGTVYLLQVP